VGFLDQTEDVLPFVTSHKSISKVRTVEHKARILAEGSKLTGEALNAYLEHEGVMLADFEQWHLSLEEDGRASAATTKHIRKLERELARKTLPETTRLTYNISTLNPVLKRTQHTVQTDVYLPYSP
jgi:hypothetical protein